MGKKRLTEICNITTGKLDSNAAEENGLYPYFTCSPETLAINTYAFDENAILLAGNNASGNFHCQRYSGKFNAYQRTYVITAKEGYDIDYVFYNLQINLQHFRKIAQGSQTKFLTMQILDSFQIIDRPLAEQKRLTSLLVAIDSKINCNNKIIAELEALAKTIYDYWFVQFDFPDENGNPYRSSGGEMVYNETLKREIPKGWKAGTFYDIAEFINGTACQKFRPQEEDERLPVIKIREMHEGISSNTEYVTSNLPIQYIINDGDLLFSWSGSLEVMFWSNGRGGLNQHIFKVNPIKNYPIEFIYQQLKSYVVVFQKMAESRKTTMGHITTDHLGQSKILLPPRETLEAYETIAKPVRTMVLKYEIEARQLATLREWMLPMLMNGQLSFQAQSDSDTVDVTQEEVGAHD